MLKAKTSLSSGETIAKILTLTSNGELYEAAAKEVTVVAAASGMLSDIAQIGVGYGICTTTASTVAKTVTVSDFQLLKNAIVSVLFTNSITVADATLNVNSTGAKAIYIQGSALQPGVIKAGMSVIFQYDGSHWNVIALLGQEQTASDDSLYVDLGLPSGLLWAKANIDKTQDNGFCASPYQYDCTFFSWGNTMGANPTSSNSFEGVRCYPDEVYGNDSLYGWGGINSADPWYDGQVYGRSPGAAITANLAPSQDMARAALGAPWRLPTTTEFKELFDNCEYIDANGNAIDSTTTNKLVTVKNITGLFLRSKVSGYTDRTIFIPASGCGSGASRDYRGARGYYWSSSWVSVRNARSLDFGAGGVWPQSSGDRYHGFACRPVQ